MLTPEFFQFFIELAPNNHKEWFDANRSRYENHVKKPFAALVAELIRKIQTVDPSVQKAPKDAIFRINRDIRFSKDKSPYKLHASALISPFDKKSPELPGLYLEISPEKIIIADGVFQPSKEKLFDIRAHIAANPVEFQGNLRDKNFRKYFGKLLGEKNKILPKEWKEIAEQIPEIAHKQFYYAAEYEDVDIALRNDFPDFVLKHYIAAKPLSDFFVAAFK